MTLSLHLVVPGRLDQATGGYRYGQHVVDELRGRGASVTVHELPGRFPDCDATARDAARRMMATLADDAPVVIDGLALPAFYDALPATRARVIALVHHPLGRESGLSPASARAWLAAEIAALRRVAGIIVTSPATADDLRGLGIKAHAIATVPPGTARPRRRHAARGGHRMLCVATLTPRKGHAALLAALAGLKASRWTLHCIGSTRRDPAEARRVRRLVRDYGLGRRVRLAGERSAAAVAHAYARAGLFVLASRHEGYGMAFAEALSHGLPIVGLRAGAVGRTVPRCAGILVRPGDRRALRRALQALLTRPAMRGRMARGARWAGQRLPGWEDCARGFAAAVMRFAPP